jgi:hypothetical protein
METTRAADQVGQGSELALAVQEVAYAALDAIRAMVPVDLCAYLHLPAGAGPQLFLRAPELSALDATGAFALFAGLQDAAMQDEDGPVDAEVAGFEAFGVSVRGTASRGLYMFARATGPLDDNEQRLIADVGRALGAAIQTLEDAGRTRQFEHPLNVSIELRGGIARAEVVIPGAGEPRTGHGQAAAATSAVAEAALDAIDSRLKLGALSETEVGSERVMVAVVRSDDRVAVAAVLPGHDPLQAAAWATSEAAGKLAP